MEFASPVLKTISGRTREVRFSRYAFSGDVAEGAMVTDKSGKS